MRLHHGFISPVLSVILCCWKTIRIIYGTEGEVTCQRLVLLTPPPCTTPCTQTDHITIKCVARSKLLRLCLHCVLLPLALMDAGLGLQLSKAEVQILIQVEFVSSYVFVQIVD